MFFFQKLENIPLYNELIFCFHLHYNLTDQALPTAFYVCFVFGLVFLFLTE